MRQRWMVLAAVAVGALVGVFLAWRAQEELLVVVQVSADEVPLGFVDRCAEEHADRIEAQFATEVGSRGYYALFGVHGQDDADELAGCYDDARFTVVTRRANADDRTMLDGELPECHDDPIDRRPCATPGGD